MRRTLATLALASACLFPTVGHAQGRGAIGGLGGIPAAGGGNGGGGARGNYVIGPNDAAIALMPELRNAPAPAWVKPGVRLVMHQMSATIPMGGSNIVEDPEGNLVTPTGQRVSLQENSGGGGHGYLIIDVVSVQPDAVVCDCRSYLINGVPNGPVTLTSGSGAVTTPGAVSEVYVNPTVLRPYLNLNGNGVSSTPTKYKTAGKTYDAVWQKVGAGTTVYDPETGLILHSANSSASAASSALVNGVATQIGGGTMVAMSTLVGMRQTRSPWTQGKLPPALRDLRGLVYEGAQQTFIPGVQLPPAPIQVHLDVIGRGDDFVQFKRTGGMMIGNARNDFGTSYSVSGPAQLMPIAVDPADLAALHQNQEIDRDPVTGASVVVTFVGRDRSGHDVVTVSEIYPGKDNYRADSVYDRASGLLIGTSYTNTVLHQLTRLQLKAKQ